MQLYAKATKKCSSTFDSVLFCSGIRVKNIGPAMSLNIREPLNRIEFPLKTYKLASIFIASTIRLSNTTIRYPTVIQLRRFSLIQKYNYPSMLFQQVICQQVV